MWGCAVGQAIRPTKPRVQSKSAYSAATAAGQSTNAFPTLLNVNFVRRRYDPISCSRPRSVDHPKSGVRHREAVSQLLPEPGGGVRSESRVNNNNVALTCIYHKSALTERVVTLEPQQ